ncbi:hypothetical protein [Nocardia nova]|uniref:hypothetical protein n=1 Tax=Nocardia nova TaxID=37330 RepID=UPI0011B01411|nr:hypothetical protein [Nocardia nova]
MTNTVLGTITTIPLPQFDDEHGSIYPSIHIAVSTLDNCGKVADRSANKYLGWRCGKRIKLTIVDGIVKVTETRRGRNAIAKGDYLRIPSETRTCARINRGDRLLLIAIREPRALLIYPSAQVFAAIRPSISLVWQDR